MSACRVPREQGRGHCLCTLDKHLFQSVAVLYVCRGKLFIRWEQPWRIPRKLHKALSAYYAFAIPSGKKSYPYFLFFGLELEPLLSAKEFCPINEKVEFYYEKWLSWNNGENMMVLSRHIYQFFVLGRHKKRIRVTYWFFIEMYLSHYETFVKIFIIRWAAGGNNVV